MGTHPDSDHVGGLDDVINNVQVDTVYLPEVKKQTKTYRDVESALKSVNKTAQMPEIGKEYRFEKNVVIRFWDRSKIIRKPIIILWWCSLPMEKTAFYLWAMRKKKQKRI